MLAADRAKLAFSDVEACIMMVVSLWWVRAKPRISQQGTCEIRTLRVGVQVVDAEGAWRLGRGAWAVTLGQRVTLAGAGGSRLPSPHLRGTEHP